MIALKRIAIAVATVACLAGLSSEAAAQNERFNKCIDKCNDLDHNCRFGGTRENVCFQGFLRCEDSCRRTGRPIR
jgi:hypothetical protein